MRDPLSTFFFSCPGYRQHSQSASFHQELPESDRPRHYSQGRGGHSPESRSRDGQMCANLPLLQKTAAPFPQRAGLGLIFSPKSSNRMNSDTGVFMCKIRGFWDLF